MHRTQDLDYTIFTKEVAEAAKRINATIEDETLLEFVTEEVADRVALYLRLDDSDGYDPRLVKIVARVVSSVFNQTSNNRESAEADTTIKSISDNGQSITYGDTTRNYMATVDDGELFGGFAKLLQPYRRIRAVPRKR